MQSYYLASLKSEKRRLEQEDGIYYLYIGEYVNPDMSSIMR